MACFTKLVIVIVIVLRIVFLTKLIALVYPSGQAQPVLKTSLDASATFLVMSDITRKCFFVLHLLQGAEARCVALSEYILAYPALSFAIIDSSTRRARKYNQLNNVTPNATSYDSPGSELSSLPQSRDG